MTFECRFEVACEAYYSLPRTELFATCPMELPENRPNLFTCLLFLLGGIVIMLLPNWNYLLNFFNGGLPAGWDSSGHFVLSQLYYDSHWPKLDGKIDSFFQGFNFPRFYPPLFYLICGALYWLFPQIDRVILYKLLIVIPILLIPGAISILALHLGFEKKLAFAICILSSALVSTGDQLARNIIGLGAAIEIGLSTQGLAALILIANLIIIIHSGRVIYRMILLVPFGALFFISNFHVIVAGSLVTFVYLILLLNKSRKESVYIFTSLAISALIVSPWYYQAYISRFQTPSVPISNIPATSAVLGYILLAVLPLGLALIFEDKTMSNRKEALLNTSFLLAIPILCVSIEPLGLRVPWQPDRMWAVVNIFLPIFLAYFLRVLYKFALKAETILIHKVKIFGALLFFVLIFGYHPLEPRFGLVTKEKSESISRLNKWLSEHNYPGYALTLFTRNRDFSIAIDDISVTHYVALSGVKGIWSIFRESSFNSIFATVLRNLASTEYESYGLPSTSLPEEYEKIDLRSRIASLSRWGIGRLILRTENLKAYNEVTSEFEVEYSEENFSILRLRMAPLMSENFSHAIIFVGSPIVSQMHTKTLDFASIAVQSLLNLEHLPPILLFRSCDELKAKINMSNLTVTCSEEQECCNQKINNFGELISTKLLNQINGVISNETALLNEDISAAPWRKVKLTKNN